MFGAVTLGHRAEVRSGVDVVAVEANKPEVYSVCISEDGHIRLPGRCWGWGHMIALYNDGVQPRYVSIMDT